MKRIIAITLCITLLLAGCGVRSEGRKKTLSEEDAAKEMASLLTKVDVTTKKDPVLDIYSDEISEADALADIDTFPITVQGNGSIDVEIAAATELSADAPDDWLNEVARKFNSENHKVNNKSVSVSVRKITSGEVVTYILNDRYAPDAFIPSNEAWGKMLDASGYETTRVADRIAGNTAGILIKKSVYDDFITKYKEVTVKNVLTAANEGDLVFAYTNPYTSSTGLNVLCAMLASFDENDPLSDAATQALLEYQKKSPPVAYTTAVLRNQAAKGVINAMVMEEQAYINTPELKNYIYTPVGIRHDHPVYVFDWTGQEEREAVDEFVKYCLSEQSQTLASRKGFNLHNEYEAQDTGMDGRDYLAAQKVWKQNKNGGRPIAAVFVADISGSMNGEPLNSLKESLIAASPYIGQEHYIGLVSYSDDVTVNLPVAQFDATQRAYFAGEVKSLNAGGSTATYDALLVGMNMLKEAEKNIPDAKLMLFLLTDGEQNNGYKYDRVDDVVGGLGIPVYTIAYNYSDISELEDLSNINEAAQIKADSSDVSNVLRNLFNVNL